MKLIETPDLVRGALDLEPARIGVRGGDRGPDLSRPQPSLGQPQRVPAKAQRIQAYQGGAQNPGHGQHPAPWSQGPQERLRPQGNTFRSSSKCGPSLRLVQSPPQTIAVP